MNHEPACTLPNAIDRLCDSLTVALCSVEALGQEGLNTPRKTHLDRAEKAIEQAGKTAWEIMHYAGET